MTNITTSRSKTFACRFIGMPMRNMSRLILEIDDERTLPEIAADFDGLEHIKKNDDAKPGETVVYEGFSVLTGAAYNADGTIRLTLERPKGG